MKGVGKGFVLNCVPQSVASKSAWACLKKKKTNRSLGFPGGPVGKNPPANAGDTASIPGPGKFHMPLGN